MVVVEGLVYFLWSMIFIVFISVCFVAIFCPCYPMLQLNKFYAIIIRAPAMVAGCSRFYG